MTANKIMLKKNPTNTWWFLCLPGSVTGFTWAGTKDCTCRRECVVWVVWVVGQWTQWISHWDGLIILKYQKHDSGCCCSLYFQVVGFSVQWMFISVRRLTAKDKLLSVELQICVMWTVPRVFSLRQSCACSFLWAWRSPVIDPGPCDPRPPNALTKCRSVPGSSCTAASLCFHKHSFRIFTFELLQNPSQLSDLRLGLCLVV